MPKVSVLIPAYNVEDYICECIDSILSQTLQDFEIVCVDDCSTDRTLEILRDYEKKDNRIKVYKHDINLGQAAGRNHALEHATGEYVYMLDADDKIVSETLEDLYDICHRDALDVAGFETMNFSEDSGFSENVKIKTISYKDTEVLNGREALTYCMSTETMSLSTPTFIMRRDYLNDKGIRFVEGILHEDVGYTFEIVVRAERVRFIHKIYFHRRIRANSTMTKGFTEKNIEGYLKSFYRSFELEPEFAKYFGQESDFSKAYRKWQRDIFGRLNQLYLEVLDQNQSHGENNVLSSDHLVSNNEEIRRAFEMLKLQHYRMAPLDIKECYLTGMGQYTERAIEALGAQGLIIRGIIVLDKAEGVNAFHGFPVIEAIQADARIPVVLSVSRYTKQEFKDLLHKAGFRKLIECDF